MDRTKRRLVEVRPILGMSFNEETMHEAFERSGGRCECTRQSCSQHYMTRCSNRVTTVTAQYHRRKDHPLNGADALNNCEVLCMDCAHQAEMDAFSLGYAEV